MVMEQSAKKMAVLKMVTPTRASSLIPLARSTGFFFPGVWVQYPITRIKKTSDLFWEV